MSDRLLKESDVLRIAFQLPLVVNSAFANLVKALPSADRPQEWTPCSEKLPTKEGHYLCSFKKPRCIDNIYVDLAYWTGGRWYGYLAPEIKAWMPLPEPWKNNE